MSKIFKKLFKKKRSFEDLQKEVDKTRRKVIEESRRAGHLQETVDEMLIQLVSTRKKS